MTTPKRYLAVFLADPRRLVEGAAGTETAFEERRFAGLVREPGGGDVRTAPAAAAFDLPVRRFWDPALRAATSPRMRG
jgi:hypothetical protein